MRFLFFASIDDDNPQTPSSSSELSELSPVCDWSPVSPVVLRRPTAIAPHESINAIFMETIAAHEAENGRNSSTPLSDGHDSSSESSYTHYASDSYEESNSENTENVSGYSSYRSPFESSIPVGVNEPSTIQHIGERTPVPVGLGISQHGYTPIPESIITNERCSRLCRILKRDFNTVYERKFGPYSPSDEIYIPNDGAPKSVIARPTPAELLAFRNVRKPGPLKIKIPDLRLPIDDRSPAMSPQSGPALVEDGLYGVIPIEEDFIDPEGLMSHHGSYHSLSAIELAFRDLEIIALKLAL